MRSPLIRSLPAAALLGLLTACWDSDSDGDPESPQARAADSRYLGSQSCVECHEAEMRLWLGSHHERAMGLPTPDNVRGDFGDVTFTHFDVTSRMFREGDHYLVQTQNRAGELEIFKVAYTFGWEPLQQYLVRFPDGRLQTLPLCWDTDGQRWFHIYPDEPIPPDDPLHWTRSMQNWDHMCAECHSTDVLKRFDWQTQRFATRFAEINVGCEACHGPGSRHVELAQQATPDWESEERYALADVDSTARQMVESCAKCHSRRATPVTGHQPGDAFYDHYLPELIVPHETTSGNPAYHPDGQIEDEDYVYGSFIQSKMYSKRVRCNDCHDVHSARLRADGNALCSRCHDPDPESPRVYDTPAHHFHAEGTPGSFCVDCHMPASTYMVVDPRRDHSLRIPRPDLAVQFDLPDACTGCHSDRDARWSAQWVTEWYGPERPPDLHHTATIVAAQAYRTEAEAQLIRIVDDFEHSSAFVRASALLLLRHYHSEESFAAAERATRDREPLVRITALAKLEALPPEQRPAPVAPLLNDPARIVRMEAARILEGEALASLRSEDRPAHDAALRELEAGYQGNLDRAESHLSLGVLAENRRRPQEAERAYRMALKRDDIYVPARVNLARLLNVQGRNEEAERLLLESIRLWPEWGDGYYSLGLLLAEDPNRLPAACAALARAVEGIPYDPRVRYNYALALWKTGALDDASRALAAACALDPRNPDYLFYLAQIHVERADWRAALSAATASYQLAARPQCQQLIGRIERAMR